MKSACISQTKRIEEYATGDNFQLIGWYYWISNYANNDIRAYDETLEHICQDLAKASQVTARCARDVQPFTSTVAPT